MNTRVLLDVGPYKPCEVSRQALRAACGTADVVDTTESTTIDQLDGSQFDVLVAEDIPQNQDAWRRVRFVQLLSAGINHLKGHWIWEANIPVANASGTHTVPIAQYVTCTVLMAAHRMPSNTRPAATREWIRDEVQCQIVRGQTVGIIGYGSIGRECGRQLSALGMKVVCLKRNPDVRRDEGFTAWPGTGDPEGVIPARWFAPGQLHEMLPLCDVVVVTAPYTKETFGMIGAAELTLLKPTAIVVNVARGGIVDETALAQALRQAQLAGAVVDCFTTEPPPRDHPLFDAPNLILTPHMAGVSDSFWPNMARLVRENLTRLSAGRPVLNRVSPQVGY